MKHLQLTGLAALAAAVLTAALGAGTASATTLCATNTTPCAAKYLSGTTYTASLKSGTVVRFESGFSVIDCSESAFGLEQTGNGGGTGVNVGLSLTSLSFGSCNGTFNVTALGSGNLAYTSGHDGELTGSGTHIEIIIGKTKCFYGGEITSGLTVTGGAPAGVTASNVGLTRQTGSSILCANPARVSASYAFHGENSTAYVAES